MKKVLAVVVNIFLIGMCCVCLVGVFSEDKMVGKIINAIIALIACPLINYPIIKMLNNKNVFKIQGGILIFVIVAEVLYMGLSPISINEKDAIYASVEVLKERYPEYEKLDMKKYDMKTDDEKDGKIKVVIDYSFIASKDGKSSDKKDQVIIYYNTETRHFMDEKGKDIEYDKD